MFANRAGRGSRYRQARITLRNCNAPAAGGNDLFPVPGHSWIPTLALTGIRVVSR